MEERTIAPTCERGSDLIAFMYGEDPDEAREFETHLKTCQQCKKELASFLGIRDSVLAWKQEALGVVPANVAAAIPQATLLTRHEPKKPSALAAIRGFFDLSPLWMKAAVAFGFVVFCVALALAPLRVFDNTQPVVVDQKRYTETELKTEVEKALQEQRELIAKQDAPPVTPVSGDERRYPKRTPRPIVAVQENQKAKQRPLTKSERQQLAADLRLITADDDSDFGLLGDRINR